MEYHVAKDPAHKNCVHRYSWRVEIAASSWALQSSELGTQLTSSDLLSLIPSSKKMDLPQLYLQGTPTDNQLPYESQSLWLKKGCSPLSPTSCPLEQHVQQWRVQIQVRFSCLAHIFCTLLRSLTFEIWMKSVKIPILYRDLVESAAAWSQHMLFSFKT